MSPWLHEFATRENSARPKSPGSWSPALPTDFPRAPGQARPAAGRQASSSPRALRPEDRRGRALGPASPPPRHPARGPAVGEGVTVPPGLAAPAPQPPPPTFCPLPAYVTSWGPAAAPWRPGAEGRTWWAGKARGRKEAGPPAGGAREPQRKLQELGTTFP